MDMEHSNKISLEKHHANSIIVLQIFPEHDTLWLIWAPVIKADYLFLIATAAVDRTKNA